MPAPLGPVVGIGASAGGLAAVTKLIEALPATPGMAFLVVMHLPVAGESHLPSILSRSTQMPVVQATDGMLIEKDHVYVIPPGGVLTVSDGHLAVAPRRTTTPHMPVDHLFRSLADTHKGLAIGVILSGDGTDGALACKDIKAGGGITFAQDEKTARHSSMPRSAVADGHVDYVLAPADIARELVRLTRHPYEAPPPAQIETEGDGDDAVYQILALLRSRTEVDFLHYKRTTIRRRIQRRMALRGMMSAADYLHFLRDDAQEVLALFQDLLIRVTQFFRDPEAFEALKEKAFPHILEGRPANSPIRIWVSGCATGEEVYSLAIVLLEYLAGHPEQPPIKILATDLNDAALERARSGVYLDNIEIDVSPERLRKYFVRAEGSYLISKAVRELCVFSRHNMGSDPPFSHLDLISCRNVLIYMDAPLQRRVIPILHYALNPQGALFLGSSESIGPFTDLFSPLDGRHRIFAKKVAATPVPLEFGPYVLPEGSPRR
jgi:two-component system CheB/CheR fusion protein